MLRLIQVKLVEEILFIIREISKGEEYKKISDIDFFKTDLGGLRIGMKMDKFKKQLGKKYNIENNKIEKAFISKIDMAPSEIKKFKNRGINVKEYPFWDVIVNITGTFSDSSLIQLNVCKTVTN